jgi:hypothetical protein
MYAPLLAKHCKNIVKKSADNGAEWSVNLTIKGKEISGVSDGLH